MKTLAFLSTTSCFMAASQAKAQSVSNSDSAFPLLVIILILWFIVAMIMLIRIWKTSNDVKALKAKICNKGLAEKSIMRSEVMKLHLLEKDDEALEILNDALYNEARRLYISINDSKDYKGMVYHQNEEGAKKITCQDAYDAKWNKTIEKYKPLYDSINKEVPDGLKSIGYQYIKDFGAKKEETKG